MDSRDAAGRRLDAGQVELAEQGVVPCARTLALKNLRDARVISLAPSPLPCTGSGHGTAVLEHPEIKCMEEVAIHHVQCRAQLSMVHGP